MITKEEWLDWKRNPVTQKYLSDIIRRRESIKEGVAEGQAESTNDLYVQMGRTQGIKDCFEYAIRDFEYTEIEDKDGT